MSERHRYSPDEVEEYFDRICLPHTRRVHDVTRLSDEEKVAFLQLLSKHHLVKVPWENLTQHYSWHHVVHIKPQHLFRKIVRDPGRGGYCMEANLFFHHILLSLRFDVYMCGSRIWKPARNAYAGFAHVINLITIGSTKYLVDGGYGGMGPSCAVPLEADVVHTQVAPAQMRLLHSPLPQALCPSQRVWIFQSRHTPAAAWTPCYCFPETEFLPQDIEHLNFEPWLDRATFFTHRVVAVRFSTAGERNGPQGPGSPGEAAMEGGEIDGAVTLDHDVLRWRRRGQKVVEIPFRSEADRVEALQMYFGITLADEDVEGIRGTAAAISVGTGLVD